MALSLWTSAAHPFWLAVASVGVALATLWPHRRRPVWHVGTVVLVAAILLGFLAHRQVDGVLNDWDRYWNERVVEIEADLKEELDRRQEAGEAAADALAALWENRGAALEADDLAVLLRRSGAAALVLYDPDGGLLAWSGEHRGKVPEDVQHGERRHAYRDLPLFGYLYVTSVAEDGSVAVAAYLLRAALPEALRADVRDLVARFYLETGERIRITEEDPGIAEVMWDLALDQDRLLSVVLERPESATRARTIMDRWTGRISLILVTSWLLLAIGAPRTRAGAVAVVLGLFGLVSWLPFVQLGGLENAFDPRFFSLPGPLPLTLGRLAIVGVAAFTLVAVAPSLGLRTRPWMAAAIVALAFPALTAWVHRGAAPTALAGARLEWVMYELALAALLSLVAGVALASIRDGPPSRAALVSSMALGTILAAGHSVWIARTAEVPTWPMALWALPIGLAAFGVRGWTEWQGSALRWVVAILLGGSAAVPAAWGHRFEARMAEGRERLRDVQVADHPEIEEALLRFAVIADSLDRVGAIDVSILYDGWLRSGLAELGEPVWLQIHRPDGSPAGGLRVGVERGEPEPLAEMLQAGWTLGGVQLQRLDHPSARYILTTRLEDADLVSAVVPPFPDGGSGSALSPLFRASSLEEDLLNVQPLGPEDAVHETGPVVRPARDGWQIEVGLAFDDAPPYHAHYRIELPRPTLAVARASLLLVMNLILAGAFWLTGRLLVVTRVGRGARVPRRGITFRARVTLALFGFFALANALFGTVAYQTLGQTSRRSAQVIAERIVEDAAGWHNTLGGSMERLAAQVGAELLEYRGGELESGSVPELVELGFYEAWIPFETHELLESREIEQEFAERPLGRWEYVTAFRRLPAGGVLAAQVPLQAGTTALRTTDLLELLGFVVLLGGALSLGLAMMAGRALTRPLHFLLVASESVGAGDLGLRLPPNRSDEFGAVFRAFNRMVERVRRARRQLVRTSRRTQLIMDEAAVGMVALDALGRVTLVNPRAADLLGTAVTVGRPLPTEGDLAAPLTEWLQEFLDGTADEATSDFQARERRVRVRVRRLGNLGTDRGVVVALDDVTDELRAERVLAWGEMARQVAHEVKNPLTPIKLSIQHVRRAWDDGRADFEEILVRNADAMLSEIDRLAGIAQSFSRFGAPGEESIALEAVSVSHVVDEVMALYGGAGGGVRFEQDVAPDLPPVVARPAELKEVLVNLLENARLAGQDGTLVSIVGRRGDADSVLLEVVDDGHGIPPEVLPRIFEPQFSTRSTGTGLGLAIVQRVVRAWGGSVGVRSEVGRGTTVSVTMRVWMGADGQGGSTGPSTPS